MITIDDSGLSLPLLRTRPLLGSLSIGQTIPDLYTTILLTCTKCGKNSISYHMQRVWNSIIKYIKWWNLSKMEVHSSLSYLLSQSVVN